MDGEVGHVVLLVMESERWSGSQSLKKIVTVAQQRHNLIVDEALVLGKKQPRAAVRDSIHSLIKTAIRTNRAIWTEIPEAMLSPSSRESTRLTIGLAAFFGVPMYLGSTFETLDQYLARRSARLAVDHGCRVAVSCREVATDLACESLIADYAIQATTTPQRHRNVASRMELEIALLQRIGLSDDDIVGFINSIVLATKGRPISEADLPADASTEGYESACEDIHEEVED